MAILVLVAVVAAIALLVGLYLYLRKRRRDRFAAWAAQRGWMSSNDRDPSLSSEFSFIDRLQRGEDRYGFETLRGTFNGREAVAFSHHLVIETDGSDSDGNSRTNRDTKHHSVVALKIERFSPELKIGKENVFRRLGHLVTGRDIDFESSEFSRRFEVMSPDRGFAYAVCNPQMIEYLLNQPIESIEIGGPWMAIVEKGRLDLDSVDLRLAHLHRMRELMPASLFQARS